MGVEIKYVNWFDVGRQHTNLSTVVYPWHKWLNGSLWLLVPGEDFDMSIKQFQQYAHGYAAKWGIKIRTKMNEANTALFFQAYHASSKQGDRRRRHFRRFERTWQVLHEGRSKWDYEPSDFLKDGKWDGSQWLENEEASDDGFPSEEEAAGAVWARDDDDQDDQGVDDGDTTD